MAAANSIVEGAGGVMPPLRYGPLKGVDLGTSSSPGPQEVPPSGDRSDPGLEMDIGPTDAASRAGHDRVSYLLVHRALAQVCVEKVWPLCLAASMLHIIHQTNSTN